MLLRSSLLTPRDNRYAKNKELGLKLGSWKAGQLVADDAGEVEQALKELEKQSDAGEAK